MIVSKQQKTHLFLMVLDSQFQPSKIIIPFILQEIYIIPVVEDQLELFGAACLVEQIFGKLLTLLRELLVLKPKFIFHFAELLKLPAELEGCQKGVLAGQGDERGACQGPVDV